MQRPYTDFKFVIQGNFGGERRGHFGPLSEKMSHACVH